MRAWEKNKVEMVKMSRLKRYVIVVLLQGLSLCCWADSIPEQAFADTVSYELPMPKSFNALRFSMDSRHRYMGDAMEKGINFLDFGPGIMMLKHANTGEAAPVATMHLRFGRQFNQLHTARIGLSGGMGYIASGMDGDGPQTLMGVIGGDIDYLFSLSNYLLGYRPERPLDVSVMLGLGYNHYMIGGGHNKDATEGLNGSSSSHYFQTGLQLKFFAGPKAAITLEPYMMLSKNCADLADQGTEWHKYHFDYGINLSYIYYFNNRLTPPSLAGSFKKRFDTSKRWLRGDADDSLQRAPLFVHYGAGATAYNTFSDELEVGKTWGPSVELGFGGWLSSALAVRSTIGLTSAGWARFTFRDNRMTYLSWSLDALINPFGFGRRYNWDSPVGLNFLFGYELGYLQLVNTDEHNNSFVAGYRLGMQPWVRLGRGTRFFVEPSWSALFYRKGDSNGKRSDQYAVKFGIEMLIGGPEDESVREPEGQLPGRLFIALGGGWNNITGKYKYDNQATPPLFRNALAMAGYHFNGYHGVSLSGEYLTDIYHTEHGEQRKKNWMISPDYMVNLTNVFTGYDVFRRWNFYAMAGPTVAVSSKGAYFGANFGLQLDCRVSKHLALFYQHRYYWMGRSFYGYGHDRFFDLAGTIVSSMNLGVMYSFAL